ncbi:MAG: YjbQ family protein [Betaproteobacteria bacterium]|nr:YjbQ family protein [Betaproteobacteria bacterium]
MSRTLSRTSAEIVVHTTKAPGFFDITDEVEQAVLASDVYEGFAVVFVRHTTAAIRINEDEPLLIADMTDFLKRMAPADAPYRHNNFTERTVNMMPDEWPNGHAHCQSLLLGASECIVIEDRRLMLGPWQRIFLVELDHPRRREVLVKFVGG